MDLGLITIFRAIIYNQTMNQIEQQYIGYQSRYKIYAAELYTINMAISY